MSIKASPLYIGIDIGTSGIRACAINNAEEIYHICKVKLPEPEHHQFSITQDANLWWLATLQVLTLLFKKINSMDVIAISINGTSGSVLVCDKQGTPCAPARMYNDLHCTVQAKKIKNIAPKNTAAHGASAGLAKLLYLHDKYPQAKIGLHQADWIIGKLCGRFNISDENNALKTGYDPTISKWPAWLNQLKLKSGFLPNIVPPGTAVAKVKTALLKKFNLNPQCTIISGTTDSIAAFIATGANKPGDAVTSLGSTLVLKIVTEQPIFAPELGIYSHKFGKFWLAGGASNSGGCVLTKHFKSNEINELSLKLNLNYDLLALTNLDYYPLTQAGERFPVNNPELQPRLTPPAKHELEFFQAILEGISRIELEGYIKLQQLGATFPEIIETCGGGSSNKAWHRIREFIIGVKTKQAKNSEACYGSALLAKRGICGADDKITE